MALTPAIDIFAFGMCALETAALELTTAGEDGSSKVKVSKKKKTVNCSTVKIFAKIGEVGWV